jgi:hypothetical protein
MESTRGRSVRRLNYNQPDTMLVIKPFTEDLISAVKEFNARLRSGGAPPEVRFPENVVPRWLPKKQGSGVFQEIFLAVDDNTVRGGYLIKHQEFAFGDRTLPAGFFRWMVSEGVVDRRFAWVGVQMLREAQRTQPLLHGWATDPLLRILQLLGWSICPVPFYFKVIRPRHFFREIQTLKRSRPRELIAEIATRTGLGGLVLGVLQGVRIGWNRTKAMTEEIESFGDWATALWLKCKGSYAMVGVRDMDTLNTLYAGGKDRFLPYRIVQNRSVKGWVVLADNTLSQDKYFGNMRLGWIVDCLAAPEDAALVIQEATRVLESRGVDLIVSNQSHDCWRAAQRAAGFLRGPSNLRFAASPELAKLLQPFPAMMGRVHYNRGDGEGPFALESKQAAHELLGTSSKSS